METRKTRSFASIAASRQGRPSDKLSSSLGFEEQKTWNLHSMAKWRERGYVPDSDEEEGDSFPFQVQPIQPSVREDIPSSQLEEGRAEQSHDESRNYGIYQGGNAFPILVEPSNTRSHRCRTSFPEENELFSPSLVVSREDIDHDVVQIEIDENDRHTSPTADRLRSVLNIGLEQVQEALGRPVDHNRIDQSEGSSSSPLSSVEIFDDDFLTESIVVNSASLTALPPSSTITGRTSPQPLPETEAPTRNLRIRNDIQLHPYALENARYQKLMREKGLQPVRAPVSPTQRNRDDSLPAEDSQSAFSSSPAEQESDLASSHACKSLNSHTELNLQQDDEDDLPDLDVLNENLTSTRPLRTQYDVNHTPRRFNAKTRRGKDETLGLTEYERDSQGTSLERPTFFVPPSPPHSSRDSTPEKNFKLHDQGRKSYETPRQSSTPLRSQEEPSKKRPVVEIAQLSSQPFHEHDGAEAALSSSEEESMGVNKIDATLKRRIKGVLPASWLKLDLKQQNAKPTQQKALQSTRELPNIRGVAKSIGVARPSIGASDSSALDPQHQLNLGFSDEDSSADDSDLDVSTLHFPSRDVLEDNRVDAMLPSKRRNSVPKSKSRKRRQQRFTDGLRDTLERPAGTLPTSSIHRKITIQPRKAARTKRQRRSHPIPRLSVLDAPGFVELSTTHQPGFLKVLSRNSHQGQRKASQTPNSKFLKLATEKDTQDINQSLEDWKDGHIRPIHHHPTLRRQPEPRVTAGETQARTEPANDPIPINPVNNPQTYSVAAETLKSLRNTTDATIQRILYKQHGLNLPSKRKIPAATASIRTSARNLRQPVHNRAGLGAFHKPPASPRAAQLEHTRYTRPFPNLLRPKSLDYEATSSNFGHPDTSQSLPLLAGGESAPIVSNQRQISRISHVAKGNQILKARMPRRTRHIAEQEYLSPASASKFSIPRASAKTKEEADAVMGIIKTLILPERNRVKDEEWEILLPSLYRWLDSCLQQKANTSPPIDEGKRAREIFRWCNVLISEYKWPVSDDFLRKAAWLFSEFDMNDPFDNRVNPFTGLPPFLSEITSATRLVFPTSGETSFHIFLNILAMSLTEKSRAITESGSESVVAKKKKSELQSFINRLYPNNGQLLSEQEAVQKKHLAALWNRTSLYLTLYCYTAEPCRPRLSQFKRLIDFSKSHMKACEIILAMWAVLACFHARSTETTQIPRLGELSEWIQAMISVMLLKWSNAQSEVERQLEGRVMEDHARHVVLTNRLHVESFLQTALNTWSMAIGACKTRLEASHIFSGQDLRNILSLFADIYFDNDDVLRHLLVVFDKYLRKCCITNVEPITVVSQAISALFPFTERVLTQRFNLNSAENEPISTRDVNRRLVYTWSILASSMVAAKEKTWDDFLEPVGKHSWERFHNARHAAQYKILFVAYIVADNQHLYLDNKFWYLSYWLKALLQPVGEWVFENELSKAVLEADQYEPILLRIPFLLPIRDRCYDLSLSDLKHNIVTMLETIIEGIAIAANYNSQAVDAYALRGREITDLLKLIMRTLKANRMNLDPGSDVQCEYDRMICKLVGTMERSTEEIVPLDRWFRDTEFLDMGKTSLRRRFGCNSADAGELRISKDIVVWFQLTCQKAAIEQTQDHLSQLLYSVYADLSEVSDIEWYYPQQVAMMQQVFPEYLECAFTEKGGIIGAPLLRCLADICDHAVLRAVNIESSDFSQLIDAFYALIVAARLAIQQSNIQEAVTIILEHPLSKGNPGSDSGSTADRGLTFYYVCRIARVAVQQFVQVIRHVGDYRDPSTYKDVIQHIHYIFGFMVSFHRPAKDGRSGHGQNLLTIQSYSLSNHQANEIKVFARDQLEKGLQSWSRGDDGRWWVMQGIRRSVVKGRTSISMSDVRDMLQREMKACLEFYADFL